MQPESKLSLRCCFSTSPANTDHYIIRGVIDCFPTIKSLRLFERHEKHVSNLFGILPRDRSISLSKCVNDHFLRGEQRGVRTRSWGWAGLTKMRTAGSPGTWPELHGITISHVQGRRHGNLSDLYVTVFSRQQRLELRAPRRSRLVYVRRRLGIGWGAMLFTDSLEHIPHTGRKEAAGSDDIFILEARRSCLPNKCFQMSDRRWGFSWSPTVVIFQSRTHCARLRT